MIRSMTGYGRAEITLFDRKFSVEIKSVNHRYNEINVKLPRMLSSREDKIKARVAESVFRGKTDVYIHIESFSEDDIGISVNEPLAKAYIAALERLREKFGLEGAPTLDLVSRLPELVTVSKNLEGDERLELLSEGAFKALDAALARFSAMRETEGAALARDLAEKRLLLIDLTADVAALAPGVAAEHEKRLRRRVEDALAGAAYDEARLLQEVAIFADKACIDEELTRLESHIGQLGGILGGDEPAGRKLDFLVQEINREINTIGSKSNDAALTRLVVDMKSAAEKIREQVQNIE